MRMAAKEDLIWQDRFYVYEGVVIRDGPACCGRPLKGAEWAKHISPKVMV